MNVIIFIIFINFYNFGSNFAFLLYINNIYEFLEVYAEANHINVELLYLINFLGPITGLIFQPLIGTIILHTPNHIQASTTILALIGFLLASPPLICSNDVFFNYISKFDIKYGILLLFSVVFCLLTGLNIYAAALTTKFGIQSCGTTHAVTSFVIFSFLGGIASIIFSNDFFTDYTLAINISIITILFLGLLLSCCLKISNENLVNTPIDCIALHRWEYITNFLCFCFFGIGSIIAVQYLAFSYFTNSTANENIQSVVSIIQQILSVISSIFVCCIYYFNEDNIKYTRRICFLAILSSLPMGIFWWHGIINYWYIGAIPIILSGVCNGILVSLPYIYIIRALSGYPKYMGIAFALFNFARVLMDLLFQIILELITIWSTSTLVITYGLASGIISGLIALISIGGISVNFPQSNE